jgi:hypothetical protein
MAAPLLLDGRIRHELRLGQLCKAASQPHQLIESASFYDPAAIEHQDQVRVADGGQPVSDHQGRTDVRASVIKNPCR